MPSKQRRVTSSNSSIKDNKRFSRAADNNKEPIYSILKNFLKPKNKVLEFGSGTGQHINYFSQISTDVYWQPADLLDNHDSIKAWIHDLPNVNEPLYFNVNDFADRNEYRDILNNNLFDLIYTANTFHIMSWPEVIKSLELVSKLVKNQGYFIVYGPFNISNQYTSESNKIFDQHLKQQNPKMGLRDLENVIESAKQNKLYFKKIYDMPANNKIIVFIREDKTEFQSAESSGEH